MTCQPEPRGPLSTDPSIDRSIDQKPPMPQPAHTHVRRGMLPRPSPSRSHPIARARQAGSTYGRGRRPGAWGARRRRRCQGGRRWSRRRWCAWLCCCGCWCCCVCDVGRGVGGKGSDESEVAYVLLAAAGQQHQLLGSRRIGPPVRTRRARSVASRWQPRPEAASGGWSRVVCACFEPCLEARAAPGSGKG